MHIRVLPSHPMAYVCNNIPVLWQFALYPNINFNTAIANAARILTVRISAVHMLAAPTRLLRHPNKTKTYGNAAPWPVMRRFLLHFQAH